MTRSFPWPDESPWPKLDTGTAHSARVWNYLLGGKDNFAADHGIGKLVLCNAVHQRVHGCPI